MGDERNVEPDPAWVRVVMAFGSGLSLTAAVLITVFGAFAAARALVDQGIRNADLVQAIVVLPAVAVGGFVGLGGNAATQWAVARMLAAQRGDSDDDAPAPR